MTDRVKIAALLFGLSALIYGITAPGHMQTGDNRSELATAQSIVDRGDFTVRPNQPNVYVPYVTSDDGLPYGPYGIAASLVLLPAVLVGNLADCPEQPGGCPESVQHATDFAASFVCGIFAALAVVVLFLFALDLGASLTAAVALALMFGLTTIEWPYAHDAYDIGPTTLFILLSLFSLHRGVQRKNAGWLAMSGAAIGLAILTRIPAVVFLPVFGLYLLGGVRTEQRRGALTAVAAWGGPVAIAFAVAGWYNWVRFGTPFDGGQSRIGAATFSTPLMTGVVGQLFSPGKSLFLFSPPLLVGLAGLPAFMRKNFGLGVVIVGAAAINIAFYGRYYEWAGDYAWGARYIVPLTGLLLLPAVAVLSRWRSLPLVARAGIIVSAVAGFAIQVLGVSIDYLHQMLLERFQGVDPRTYWAFPYSAIWRHAVAFWQVLNGAAPYPSDQVPMDITLGLPQFTTFDFWWVYAWFNGTNPILIGAIVGCASLLIVGLAYKLWVATLAGARASGIAN
jgi:Dolichyl-phosphate-mannose-protein mannosyltransferase